MKTILPWLCVAALGVGLAFLYTSNQKQATELTQLRADSQELQTLRAAAEESKKNQTQSESAELTQLREDNKDLLRLRAEVGKLRKEKEQLGKQAQTAEAQAQNAQAQAQAAQALVQNAQQQAQTAQAQAAALRLNVTPEARAGVCINNLRQIDAAKQQWALENARTPDAIPTPADMARYLPTKALPICPAGGAYALNAVNTKPTCNVAGHVLP
jgi:hypothetical protein